MISVEWSVSFTPASNVSKLKRGKTWVWNKFGASIGARIVVNPSRCIPNKEKLNSLKTFFLYFIYIHVLRLLRLFRKDKQNSRRKLVPVLGEIGFVRFNVISQDISHICLSKACNRRGSSVLLIFLRAGVFSINYTLSLSSQSSRTMEQRTMAVWLDDDGEDDIDQLWI